ncbi:MAG: acyl-CoA dehydrogenase family protein, partial [Myxococcota bacterium]
MNTPVQYDEEHALLRAEARRWLDERFPIARVRALADSDSGDDPGDWRELAALGWLGLCVPEKLGGAGLGAVHMAVLLEETGRRLLPCPLLSSTLAALAIAQSGSDAQRERWLRPVVAGELRLALALSAQAVWGGSQADAFVARRGERFAVVAARAPGARVDAELVLDRTRRSARVTLDDVDLESGDFLPASAGEVLARLTPWACAALAAEMAGGADALLALTSSYAATREQFGKPIGSFQAVKHPLVNVLIGVESLRSLV